MYICICKAVTDSQILTAIENGVCTRKQLIHCFGVGKDCGKWAWFKKGSFWVTKTIEDLPSFL